MDVFKPRGSQKTRSPVTDQQQNGQIINQPRYAHLGGLTGAGKVGGKNKLAVKTPGDGQKII